jgi:beta-glucosidase
MFLDFPKSFLWGAATSAHQVEGGNFNDWSEWEKENAERLAQEAEKTYSSWLPSWSEVKNQPRNPANYISGRACDHYHLYEQDFDLAKELGHNAHRFSIEWSRIEPEEGKFNQKEIEHYRKVLLALRRRGLEPFVTLWHWTNPLWLAEFGGPENEKFPLYFARYTKFIIENLKDLVKFWITVNEPTSVIMNSYLRGLWPPQKKSLVAALKVYKNLAQAHNLAYKQIHQISKETKVGFANILVFWEPFNKKSILDNLNIKFRKYFSNQRFLNLTKGRHDFLTVQYYFHNRIKFPNKISNKNKEVSDLGWEIYPKGIYYLIKDLKKYRLPIYITENGLADAKDEKRAKFIKEHLFWVHRAIQEGADVRGYFYWSLLDNFEWDKGFWPRFGLVEVDYQTLERKPRPSAYFYAQICQENALPVETSISL